MKDLLNATAERAIRYLSELDLRKTAPSDEALQRLSELNEPFPEGPTDPETIVKILDDIGSPATVASAGGRFFGFVVGGSLPASLAANWLAGAWDQNAGLNMASPVSAALDQISIGWLLEIFDLPPGAGGGYTTGATMANFAGLAAARHALLKKQGWDVESRGLFEAPPITVVVGEEVHVSVLKALSLLGLGRDRLIRVPVDDQGRMRADHLPEMTESTIVCIQAGNVNTGAFDPADEICAAAHQAGAWVHVDGAFGLWAAASDEHINLTAGVNQADSWTTDAHKWLNVPQDSGIIICRNPVHLRAAMSTSAAYLVGDERPEPHHYVPEMSRRARSIEIWAALRSLGKSGLSDLIQRTCGYAAHFASGLREAGYRILNEVVLNQVLVSFGDSGTTNRVIEGIQNDGTCWCGGTVWQGHTAMRISVSSWATTAADVDKSLAAMLRIADRENRRSQ